ARTLLHARARSQMARQARRGIRPVSAGAGPCARAREALIATLPERRWSNRNGRVRDRAPPCRHHVPTVLGATAHAGRPPFATIVNARRQRWRGGGPA